MKPIKNMTQLEVAAYIYSKLRAKGIEVVLSGGASVSLYTDNKYISKDLDLVNMYSVNRRKLTEAMKGIGFIEENRYYRHPDSKFIVEFPPGPLAIGDEPVRRTVEKKFSTGTLKAISPTDCVKDRLAAYYHFGDKPSLAQAILVMQKNDVDMEEIRRWSEAEGELDEFEKIKKQFLGKSR